MKPVMILFVMLLLWNVIGGQDMNRTREEPGRTQSPTYTDYTIWNTGTDDMMNYTVPEDSSEE